MTSAAPPPGVCPDAPRRSSPGSGARAATRPSESSLPHTGHPSTSSMTAAGTHKRRLTARGALSPGPEATRIETADCRKLTPGHYNLTLWWCVAIISAVLPSAAPAQSQCCRRAQAIVVGLAAGDASGADAEQQAQRHRPSGSQMIAPSPAICSASSSPLPHSHSHSNSSLRPDEWIEMSVYTFCLRAHVVSGP